MWVNVVAFFKKIWELLKKTPGWIILALLLSFATIWWLLNRQLLLKKRLEIQKNISDIEAEAVRTRASAEATHTAETAAADEKYEEVKAKLREKEKALDESIQKGPVAVAEEWKAFLGGRK